MRGEKLLEAVGYLDPELIKSAAGPESEKTSAQEEKESAKKRSALLRRVSSAAAVFLVSRMGKIRGRPQIEDIIPARHSIPDNPAEELKNE